MRKSPLFALLAVSVASSLGASDVVGRADGTPRLPTVALVRTTTGTNAPAVLKVAGHSHTCRKPGVSMQTTYERLHEWAERNEVAAMGLGSPWSVANAAMTRHYETELRDLYFAGKATDCPFNSAEIESVIQAANDYPGNRTLFYVDNETPKSRYGHLWHIGFRVVVPNWHDYNQDRPVWYSALDDATAETNTVAGGPHKRRTASSWTRSWGSRRSRTPRAATWSRSRPRRRRRGCNDIARNNGLRPAASAWLRGLACHARGVSRRVSAPCAERSGAAEWTGLWAGSPVPGHQAGRAARVSAMRQAGNE